MSASRYSNPRIVKRAKGQRRDAVFAVDLDGLRGLPVGWTPVQVGEGRMLLGDSAAPQRVYFFEATAPSGDVHPCYSLTAGVGADGYLICQDLSYKAARAA